MMGRLFNKKNVDNISKKELYGILDELPVPIIFSEKDRTIRFANKEALKLGAYDELQGKKCTDTFCKGIQCQCLINGNSVSPEAEQRFIGQNDQERPVIKKAKSVNCNGDSFYVQFFTDLNEQHEKENKLKKIIAEKVVAEKKARNESTKFEELFEGISEAIIVNDFKGNIIKINQNACQQLGYSKEELLSMNIKDIVASEIRNKVEEELNSMLKCNHAIFESVLITKEGTKIPVEVCINVIEFDEKKVVLGTIRDITIRKKFQAELEEAKKTAENNETELKTIFNKVPSSIMQIPVKVDR